MLETRSRYEEAALLGRERHGSWSTCSNDEGSSLASDVELDELEEASCRAYQSSKRPRWWRRSRTDSKLAKLPTLQNISLRPARRRSRYSRLLRLALYIPYLLIALLAVAGLFFPSYSTPPQRYTELRQRVLESTRAGAANPHNEKVFLAASLYDKDGELLRGDWGRSLLHLVDMLGHDNVFVSIYENDPSEEAMVAMSDFRARLPCESSVVHEELDTSGLHHVLTPEGTQRLKRMSFLADVRNRALRPLEDEKSAAYSVEWDKLFYLNDVVFDPIDAANLLFSTNVDEKTGRTDYRAACATDFIMPFKFYDTFATRDLDGYDMGTPFYPWFTIAGKGQSRQDVLDQKDAVRVKSCWGGMVAFEAKWFQKKRSEVGGVGLTTSDPSTSGTLADEHASQSATSDGARNAASSLDLVRSADTSPASPPLRFRSEPANFWEASECCLIHADLAQMTTSPSGQDAGIYLNPYVRVAYSRSTLRWQRFTQRFERLYPHIHIIADWVGSRPGVNERQFEQAGEEATHWVWHWDEPGLASNGTELTGHYARENERVTPGMFCGTRKLQVVTEKREGGKGWESIQVPDLTA